MPTIDILFSDLKKLVGRELPRDKEDLTEILAFVKGEVVSLLDDELSIELKDGNRPDLWSVEGIARELRGSLGIETGLREYSVAGASGVEIFVDSKLETIRPFIGCSVVKSVHIDNYNIRELMHFQDKLDQTYGRKRLRTSIGFYKFELIHPPLHYKTSLPNEYKFIPLEGSKSITLAEILKKHPKGIEYGDILKDQQHLPILVDDQDQVLSFPPIINSNLLGKITEGKQDILVEVTGTDYKSVLNTLTMVTLSLADRGNEILSTKIHYPYYSIQYDVTPKLDTRKIVLNPRDVNQLLGLNLKASRISELLKKARYGSLIKSDVVEVTIPCYRIDVMSSVDVIEDVAISYGFNKILPIWPQIVSTGNLNLLNERSDLIREIMIGLGFQEVLTFSLTDLENQCEKMGISLQLVEVANPSNVNMTHLRGWLLPSLMDFLSSNTHVLYPQKIFEVGDCEVLDTEMQTGIRDDRKLAAIIIHSSANFSELKMNFEAFFMNLGIKCELKESLHKSFIPGRVVDLYIKGINVGFAGEFSPQVLEKWGLSNPGVGFEVNLTSLIDLLP